MRAAQKQRLSARERRATPQNPPPSPHRRRRPTTSRGTSVAHYSPSQAKKAVRCADDRTRWLGTATYGGSFVFAGPQRGMPSLGEPLVLEQGAELTAHTQALLLARLHAPQLLPPGWLLLQGSFMSAPALSNSLVLPLLIPPRITALVGQQHKHVALGLVACVQTAITMFGPLIGTLSDNWPCSAKTCGRRRPFVVFGQLAIVAGLFCMHAAPTIELLNGSYQLYFAGCLFSWIPFMSILPELVPPSQRGTAAGIQSFVVLLLGFVGNGLGVLWGEGLVSLSLIYQICMALHIVMLPVGLIALAERPGCCEAEKPPPPEPPQSYAERYGRPSRSTIAVMRDFVSPFRSAAFCWLFVSGALGGISTILQHTFVFYWYEDVIGPDGYLLFELTVAHTPQTATAIVSAVTQLAGTLAAVPGGWLADHYGRKSVYLTASILGLLPSLAFAAISIGASAGGIVGPSAAGAPAGDQSSGAPPPLAMPRFTTVLLLTALSGLVGGASASASSALMADALPCDADGQRRNASRDMLLLSLGPVLPGTVLPVLLGRLLSTVELRGQSYSLLFLCGAACSALSVVALLQVKLTDLPPSAGHAPTANAAAAEIIKQRHPPWGARLCDSLCFGESSAGSRGDDHPQARPQQRRGEVLLRRTGSE